MKKYILILFILMVGSVFSKEVMILKVDDRIPDMAFKHFGTRSKNLQILKLNPDDSEGKRLILILKGWIFVGEGMGISNETEGEMKINGRDITMVVKVILKRKGMYVNLGPYLLILPADVEKLSVMGFELNVKDM